MEIASAATTLSPLLLLACPVGMGLMMWMMARGNKSAKPSDGQAPRESSAEPASVEVLREEQRRLSEEIDRLEGGDASGAKASGERR